MMDAGYDLEALQACVRSQFHAHWQALASAGNGMTAAGLLALWSRYKFVVLAQEQRIYRQIGPLLADLSCGVPEVGEQVFALMDSALATLPSRHSHINALQHVAGFISKSIGADEKQLWLAALADYEAGRAELPVPAGLLYQQLQQYGNDYIRSQNYPACYLPVVNSAGG